MLVPVVKNFSFLFKMFNPDSDRFELIDKTRRLSTNEINAALRNIIVERQLGVHLSILKSERKSSFIQNSQTLENVQNFIKNVKITTGYNSDDTRKTRSALNDRVKSSHAKRPMAQSAKITKPGFINSLLSSSSAATSSDMYQSTSSFSIRQNNRDHLNGTSMNFNDILEISDTSESEDELGESVLERGKNSHRIKSSLQKKKPIDNIRPLTTTNVTATNENMMHANRNHIYECKTAPIERRKGGFRVGVEDDEKNDANIAAWLKYKNDKKKREKKGKIDTVFLDEKLEKKYYELCAQRDQVPRHTSEEIENMKKRDPIFAKRYKQFISSKMNGKPAHYDENDLNARVFVPKWTIERQKQVMISESRTQMELIREMNIKKQLHFDDRVKSFIKKLSST